MATNKIDIKTTGYRVDTSDNYLLNTGALFINPEIDQATKTIKAETLGATVGGLKLDIKIDLRQPQVDGLLVAVKGNDVINSIAVNFDGTFKEFAVDTISNAIHGDTSDFTEIAGYKIIKGRNKITDKDYKDVLFVGEISGQDKPMVIWIFNAINTAGLSIATKDKDEAGIPFKFEARADKDKPTDYQGIYQLIIPSADIATGLTVTSAEGATSGHTKLTVAPAKVTNNTYKYFTGPSIPVVKVGSTVDASFISWDGTADIQAVTGQEIIVVELDSTDRILLAGSATVVSKA